LLPASSKSYRWHFNPVSLAQRGFTLFPWYTIPHFIWETTSELAHLLIEKVQIFPVKYGVLSLVSAQIQLFSGSNSWFGEDPDFLLLQQLEVSWNRGTPKLSPFIFGFSPEKTIHLGCPDSTRLHPGVSISEHVVAGEDVTAPQSADVTLDVEARARREEAWRTWGCCFYSRKMNMSNRFQ